MIGGGAALIGQRHVTVEFSRFGSVGRSGGWSGGWSVGRSWENRARFGFGSGVGGWVFGRPRLGLSCRVLSCLSVGFCWFMSSGERMLGGDSFFSSFFPGRHVVGGW